MWESTSAIFLTCWSGGTCIFCTPGHSQFLPYLPFIMRLSCWMHCKFRNICSIFSIWPNLGTYFLGNMLLHFMLCSSLSAFACGVTVGWPVLPPIYHLFIPQKAQLKYHFLNETILNVPNQNNQSFCCTPTTKFCTSVSSQMWIKGSCLQLELDHRLLGAEASYVFLYPGG